MFISLQQYTALRAIQVEWLNTARSYTDRVPNFFNPANTGGLNGSAHLVPGTSALDLRTVTRSDYPPDGTRST